jgi:hypothetical protein
MIKFHSNRLRLILFAVALACITHSCMREHPPHSIEIKKITVLRLPTEYYQLLGDTANGGSLPDVIWEMRKGERVIKSSSDTLFNTNADTLIFDMKCDPITLIWEKKNEYGEKDFYYHTHRLVLKEADGIDDTDSLEDGNIILDIPFVPWTGRKWETRELKLEYEGVDVILSMEYNRD